MSCHIFEVHNVTPNDKTTAIKYLGMIFDQNLNFKYHISKVSKKLFFMHFTLFVQQKHLFRKISKKHCTTHTTHSFNVTSTMLLKFGLFTALSLLQALITKQNAAIRIIVNQKHNDYTEPLSKELSILPLTT
jgi:hypothetical protein